MIYTTTESIPGKQISEIRGVVTGNVVQSKHIGRDLMAGIKSIVGGEIRGYTEMMTDARDIAIQRMVADAESKGADAIVGIRFYHKLNRRWFFGNFGIGTAVKLAD